MVCVELRDPEHLDSKSHPVRTCIGRNIWHGGAYSRPQIYGAKKKDCIYFVYPLRIGQKSIEEFLLSITNNFLTTSAV